MVCSTEIKTGNSPMIFKSLIPNFKAYTGNPIWKKPYAPYCEDGFNKCSEYEDIPAEVSCNETPPPTVKRLCHCINKGKNGVFGTINHYLQFGPKKLLHFLPSLLILPKL